MKIIRKSIFWLHLVVGLLAGVLVLVMAVTGITLAYERQLTVLADNFGIDAPEDAQQLGIEEILASHTSKPPSSITVESDLSQPVALQYGREKTEFIHPYTGASLGEGNTVVRSFFKTMLTWHRWLGREGAQRDMGKALIGAGNLMFLFLVVSGIYLWFPKKWSVKGLKAVTLLQKRLKGRARDWSWHNVFGFWAALPLLIVVSCGTVISYPWATALVFSIAGEKMPQRKRHGGGDHGENKPLSTAGLDAALASVKNANPDWETIQLQLPAGKAAKFTVSDSHRGRPDKRREVMVEMPTAEILKTEGFESFGTGRKARTWIRWIHTGEAGGLPGQTIAGLAAASSIILVWTGFALAWRRFTKRKSRKTDTPATA
ncbi:PepSY-associated TM helix domain-containing protein [Luteolibacter algae]|uniref:PepSY-associated TM helix domain-containing protein n=1 Tax=Luteolibacter algae TaxID=454151 RepID=A0ABW5D7L6_9BACT